MILVVESLLTLKDKLDSQLNQIPFLCTFWESPQFLGCQKRVFGA